MDRKNVFSLATILLIPMLFCGCMGMYSLYSLASMSHGLIRMGTSVYNAVEQADVNAVVSPDTTEEELRKIKRITFIFGDRSAVPIAATGDLTGFVADNLEIDMMKLGFEVVGEHRLAKALEEEGSPVPERLDVNDAIRVAKILGIQAIIKGSVQSSHSISSGMMVGADMTMGTLVKNATFKIIGAEKGHTMMVVTINYKNGQRPSVAAESIAAILEVKMRNPQADVKDEVKLKR